MYTPGFFDVIRDGCRRSAEMVVPTLIDIFAPSSVIDVGCGEGWWAQTFVDAGILAEGVDGPDTKSILWNFVPHDLATPLPDLGRFDLAISLEVAEHLPSSRAAGFVADLVSLAPVVVFSAAIPGQGGTGHVNEQWPAYWVDLFAANGYAVSGALRWLIWNDDRVENWYRQNLMVATATPKAWPALFDTPMADPFPVVHPVLYDARR